MLAIVFGLIFVVLGFWGIVIWWADLLIVFKGFLPLMFVFGGLLSIIAGILSIMDSLGSKDAVELNDNHDES